METESHLDNPSASNLEQGLSVENILAWLSKNFRNGKIIKKQFWEHVLLNWIEVKGDVTAAVGECPIEYMRERERAFSPKNFFNSKKYF